ncbi:hypothetical protein DYB25_011154 [Aphanomyces astaci]|uniref:Tail-anchored protein insertion receptor WRB n=1 Tax=Aphanomyces astaci TaxID=112090 RepID=A0A397EBB6_APHAT|nr:hypothetical protein DYB25_011154 [Aphanomyces astaci]RHY22030.1 hypothetical protein DYB36_011231 [Aphanomyces astaci]RHY53907.1 hypothetical protein DYB34_002300 [Aphanomyces astaci]RHY59715.1 hypothetical protein DYB38_002162 [Aphanomyces astaci]RHY76960.1 hypothetical protein DYB30_014373 [Aphanomyces astaci]
MIQAVDAPSLLVLTLLCVMVEVLLHVLQTRGSRPTQAELALQRQHAVLAVQAKKLNSVDMFVEHSKLVRQMNTIKKQEQTLAVERLAHAAVPRYFGYIQPVLLAIVVVVFWSSPLVVFPPGRLMPVERLVAMPFFPAGSVSAGGWWLICRRVLGKVLK